MKNHFNIIQEPLTADIQSKFDVGLSNYDVKIKGVVGKSANVAFVAYLQDEFAGGVIVTNFWGALHIKTLFVEEAYRSQGVGKLLIQKALSFAKEHRCKVAFVETMSFQAPQFYEKLGFTLEFTRTGYEHNVAFHYLKISL
jgi:GNAT superfamily N-acetyltransferase